MAVLAVAGAGAWASAALGLGWQAGWLVGSTLGSLLFNKQPNQEGPRLSDLTVTSSAYGAPIPIGYGTLRMAGNIIWSSGIREEKHTERVGKGGGAKQTTYNYFASFALALAEGPAEDVLRLWADGKLIYDKRGTGTEVAKSSFTLRFYPGSETQLPDPLIEAVEGAGNVPAHRGLCYLVFEDLALEDYGNRIPNITAELTFRRVAEQPSLALDLISAGEGSVISGYQLDELGIDWRRGFAYLVNSDASASVAGIRRFNLRSMKEDRQARMTDITSASPANFPDTLFCGTDGFLYLNVGSSNSQPILRVAPDALREVARFGVSGPSLVNSTTSFAACSWMGMVSALGPQGRVDFLLTGSLFNKLGLLKAEGLAYVWGAEQAVAESRVRGVVGGIVAEGYGEGWILASASSTATNHTSLALYRIRITAFANYDAGLGQTAGVTLDLMQAFLPSEIEAGASGFYGDAGGLTYDPTDDSVIFQVQMSQAGSPGAIRTVKWRAGTGLVWSSTVPVRLNYDAGFCQSRLKGQRWSLIRGTRLVQLDTSTGTLVTDETWPLAVAENGAQVFDAATNTILVRSGPSGFVRLFLGRGSGQGETLGTVVADLCARAGLGATDVDVSELQDVVPGYVLARSSSIRAAIEPLAQAYFFDGVESDDTLQFRKRGRAPVATLNPDLLIALSTETGETWREQRTQDVELPERVNVLFMDPGADYQQGSQSQKRMSQPLPTMFSKAQLSVELPLVLTPDTAKAIATKALYSAWIERCRHEAQLQSDYLLLEPSDVVDITLPSGTSQRVRIERVDVGADYSVAIKAVSQEAASYSASVSADGGAGRAPQELVGAAATELLLPDLPLLRDIDDLGGTGSRIYALAGGYGAVNWSGAALYRSPDGIGWALVGRVGREMAWGAAQNALGVPGSPFATDTLNSLRVFMTTGGDRLESVTHEAMLNGANAALLLKANGEPEVLQFRDAVLQADGSYLLSGLLRGRRGTDIYTTGHQVGETFVLLEASSVEMLSLALGDLGLTRQWRAVGIGSLFDNAETLTATHSGRDLKPYAVAHPKAQVSGDDIALSWVRRSRIGGEWKDGIGTVPMGEASEAYEVDILSGAGGTVLRTLTAASPSVTYTSAAIATDFGVMPATLSLVIYQMSAVLGRGLPRAVTLEIAP